MSLLTFVCVTCQQRTLPTDDGRCPWCKSDPRLGPGWQHLRLIPEVRAIDEGA